MAALPLVHAGQHGVEVLRSAAAGDEVESLLGHGAPGHALAQDLHGLPFRGLEVDPLDVGGQRFGGRLILDVVGLGATDNVFLLFLRQLLPVTHGVDPALDMNVGATGKLAIGHQRHFGTVLILRVLGAIDETGQVTAIQIAETAHLFGQLDHSSKQRHHTVTGVVQHIHPIGAQLNKEIKRGVGGFLTVGGLRHKAAELGRTGGRVETIPGIGANGNQTAETGIGEIGGDRLPQGGQFGQTADQFGGIAGTIEHQIEGVQIRLCADPGLGFHISLP